MRLPISLIAAVSALLSATLGLARSSTGDRVLVILEKGISRDDYSKFWQSLEGQFKPRSHGDYTGKS